MGKIVFTVLESRIVCLVGKEWPEAGEGKACWVLVMSASWSGVGYITVIIFPHSLSCALKTCVSFVHILYMNKISKSKTNKSKVMQS